MPASATEKVLHWSVATTVLLMAATGTVMYVPWLSQLIGQRFWVRTLHLVAALGFGGPLGALGEMLHMLFHAVTKPLMFFCAGRIVLSIPASWVTPAISRK